jgi:transcriptional regulator with XRE-family HTH domain
MDAAGAYLKVLRVGLGLKMTDLANAMDTSEAQIVRIERGDNVTVNTLIRYARLVHADPSHLWNLAMSLTSTVEDAQEIGHRDVASILSQITPQKLRELRGVVPKSPQE